MPVPLDARRLARMGANPSCPTGSLPVDFDPVLAGTGYDPHIGQSPAAFAAGRRFEIHCAGPTGDYAELLDALRADGLDVGSGAVERLPDGLTPLQADRRTRRLIRRMLEGTLDVALIAQAAFSFPFAGRRAHLRPDAVVFVQVAGRLVVAELKGFRRRQGRYPADKIATALEQTAVYQLALRRVLADLGLDPDAVDDMAVIVCASGLGLKPIATRHDNSDRRRTLELRLASAEVTWTGNPTLDATLSALGDSDPARRLAAFEALALAHGTHFIPACMNHCGAHRWCRWQAVDDPARLGSPRLLLPVGSLRRTVALAQGAAPQPAEAPAAVHLRNASRLRDIAVGPSPRRTARRRS